MTINSFKNYTEANENFAKKLDNEPSINVELFSAQKGIIVTIGVSLKMAKVIYKGLAKKDSPIYTGKFVVSSMKSNQGLMMSTETSQKDTDLTSTQKSTLPTEVKDN